MLFIFFHVILNALSTRLGVRGAAKISGTVLPDIFDIGAWKLLTIHRGELKCQEGHILTGISDGSDE